ncbi:hypothetical protein JCM10908_001740 [Rhodotorula pacifica]|uniref:Tfs1p n=1 Tax=Rhodotorula pacifica TaxID=1495444 RepID=UPI00317E35D1
MQYPKISLSDAGLLGSSLIPTTFDPKVTVHATYPTFGNVQPGETYAVSETQDEPTVSFNVPAGQEAKYTVVLADPDAPSREDPKMSPFLHFALADVVPGQSAGITLTSYMGPAPPKGTGPHRYVFLVYAQPVDHTPELGRDSDERPKFEVGKFAKANELDLVGATFYYAENK